MHAAWNYQAKAHYWKKYLKEKHLSEHYQHLSFKYFEKSFLNSEVIVKSIRIPDDKKIQEWHSSITSNPSKAKKSIDFLKQSKPCHVGIHQIALAKYSQMNTHLPGFQSFFRYFALFCITKIKS